VLMAVSSARRRWAELDVDAAEGEAWAMDGCRRAMVRSIEVWEECFGLLGSQTLATE